MTLKVRQKKLLNTFFKNGEGRGREGTAARDGKGAVSRGGPDLRGAAQCREIPKANGVDAREATES